MAEGNQGSHRVESEEDKRELEEVFRERYVHIQTGIHGDGPGNNRRARRRRKFKPRFDSKGY